jgi:tetratricopeptide (TPR) repeat protein
MRFIHRTNPADLSDAKTHLQLACQLDAELAEPYPWLCYVYMRDGQLREAQRTGQRAIELLPDLVQAHYFLALAYFVSCESDPSQYQPAADHLLRAARVDPRWQPTWFVLSVLALLSGNYRRAEECAIRLLHADAASPGALQFIGAEVLLATVSLRRGDPEDAIQWLAQSATKLAASNHMYRESMMALTSCVLGDVHLRQQNPDAALLDYRQAWQTVQEYPTMLANDRNRVRALAGLAAAHAARGESERSDELILRAAATLETAKAPQSSAAGANLADLQFAVAAAHVRAENTDEALNSLECAVKAGWRDATWLQHDSELQPVRTEPRFVELDKELRRLPELDLEL